MSDVLYSCAPCDPDIRAKVFIKERVDHKKIIYLVAHVISNPFVFVFLHELIVQEGSYELDHLIH